MDRQQLIEKTDTLFGLKSRMLDDEMIYLSPTGVELLRVHIYFDELKQTWRVSAITHNDNGFHHQLFGMHLEAI
jgi:hypothetical protein